MPEWKWSLSIIYRYGLRPSEVFGAKVDKEKKLVRYQDLRERRMNLKRTAFTLDKPLVDIFDLNNIYRPWEYNMSDKNITQFMQKLKQTKWVRD